MQTLADNAAEKCLITATEYTPEGIAIRQVWDDAFNKYMADRND